MLSLIPWPAASLFAAYVDPKPNRSKAIIAIASVAVVRIKVVCMRYHYLRIIYIFSHF